MSERYYVTAEQLGIIIDGLQHCDIPTVIKTLRKITKNQFVGDITEPLKQELAVVPKLRMEPDIGAIGKYEREGTLHG